MRSNDSVYPDESLGIQRGLEPSHSPLSLLRRLMRVLRTVVQVPMLSISHA